MTTPNWDEHVPPPVRELFDARARKAALQLIALKDHDVLPVPEAVHATLAGINYCEGLLERLTMTTCLAGREAGIDLGQLASWLGADEAALRRRLASCEAGLATPPSTPRRPDQGRSTDT